MSCGASLVLWAGNTFVFEVQGLKYSTSQAAANAATVTFHLRTFRGVEVLPVSWPLAMTKVAGEDGTYRGVLPADVEVDVGKTYKYEVSAEEGGAIALWKGDLKVEERPLTFT